MEALLFCSPSPSTSPSPPLTSPSPSPSMKPAPPSPSPTIVSPSPSPSPVSPSPNPPSPRSVSYHFCVQNMYSNSTMRKTPVFDISFDLTFFNLLCVFERMLQYLQIDSHITLRTCTESKKEKRAQVW